MKRRASVPTMWLALLATLAAPNMGWAGVTEINIKLARDGSECVANFSSDRPMRVSRKERDVVAWTVENHCLGPQRLRLCMAKAPLRECHGDPEEAKVRNDFFVSGKLSATPGRATMTCHIDWDVLDRTNPKRKRYLMLLRSGSHAKHGCPTMGELPVCEVGKPCIIGSELALEVEP